MRRPSGKTEENPAGLYFSEYIALFFFVCLALLTKE
jgi:hypothetical protein